MLSFVLSSCMTLFISFVVSQLRAVGEQKHDLKKSWWFRIARKSAPARIHDPVAFWIVTLLQFARGFGDQQLITGPLLLITAFIKYVPAKDWLNLQTAIHASFLSVVSHLVSMQLLVPYLRDRKLLAHIRHVVISISLIMLASSSFIFIVHRFSFRIEDWLNPRFLFTFLIIYFSSFRLWIYFFSIIIRIHASPNAFILHELWPWEYLTPEQKKAISWAMAYKQLPKTSPQRNRVDTIVIWIWQLYANKFFSTVYLGLSMGRIMTGSPLLLLDPLSNFSVLALAALGFDWNAGKLSNSWGFGQILPMMLLLLPVLNLIESFVGEQLHVNCPRPRLMSIADQVREDRDLETTSVGATPNTNLSLQGDIELEKLVPFVAQRVARREGPLRGIQKRPTAGTMV